MYSLVVLFLLTSLFNFHFTEESQARKELRTMIQTYLSEEIKKMKTSVEEQIKSTEDTLNKKLEVTEGLKSGKGGRGSPKGKKK